MRVFLDTNVILDIPLGREGARSSQQVLELGGSPPHSLFMFWHTLSTLSYILAKARDDEAARAFLSDLLDHVEIGPASTEMAQRALVLELKDFEDAMQVVVAESVAADIIVSRNLADFSRSPVPATDPETFLTRFARCPKAVLKPGAGASSRGLAPCGWLGAGDGFGGGRPDDNSLDKEYTYV